MRLLALPRHTAPAVASAPRRSSMQSPWSSPKLKASHAAVASHAAAHSSTASAANATLCSVRHHAGPRTESMVASASKSGTNAPSPPAPAG